MTNLIAFTVGLGAVVVAALTLDAVMRHQDRHRWADYQCPPRPVRESLAAYRSQRPRRSRDTYAL